VPADLFGDMPRLKPGERIAELEVARQLGVSRTPIREAIKVLTGVGESLIGSLMIYDALEMTFRKVKIRKDPNCPICSENPKQTALLPDY
jgi:hypothetical protein